MSRVLIIEDDCGVAAALALGLRAAGYAVEVEPDGVAGLERLQAPPRPDVVLLDLMLPRLDGPGVLAAMAGDVRFEGLPVIVMTASGRSDLGLGCESYRLLLRKPFTFEQVLDAVASLEGPSEG